MWATSPLFQAKKGGEPVNEDENLFSSEKDFTFQRAVYEYVHGDKQKAFLILGHILHLLEDLTSVPHVRNDSHISLYGIGDKSYYEEYTDSMDLADLLHIQTTNIKKYNSLEDLFYQTAKYTNENFLSKDTVFKDYDLPKLNKNLIKGDYAYNNIGSKLVHVKTHFDKDRNLFIDEINLDNKQVLSDYWRHLSQKAV